MSAGPVAGGLVSMLFGAGLLSALLVAMNAKQHRADEARAVLAADIKVEKKKKPPEQQRVKKRPKPKKRSRPSPAPRPRLGANMTGLGVGLPMFDGGDLGGDADGLLGTQEVARDMVMTQDAVDEPPRPRERTQIKIPERVRARGITGRIVARVLIGAEGRVEKIKIVESQPPGVFDEAVKEALSEWVFSAATYKGSPVSMWVNLPFEFRY